MGKEVVFAILPYLKTSESLIMRGIRFRSSDDLADLAPEQQEHLKTLFSMFFLRDDLRITRMIYALLELEDDPEANQRLFQRLSQAHALIGYLSSMPQPPREDPFLPLEHASMYSMRNLFSSTLFGPMLLTLLLKISQKTELPQKMISTGIEDSATGGLPSGP